MRLNFSEFEWYDVASDQQMIRFSATGEAGTWFVEIPITTASQLRARKAEFKEHVIGAVERGDEPCELEF